MSELERTVTDAIAALRSGFGEKAIRVQYGETMVQLAAENPDFIVLTADLMYATGMDRFGATYPGRLINVGIAEQNMTGVAAGLALSGKLPVVDGYAAFTTLRAVEQAKVDAAYNYVKVILTGQSAGLSYGVGGPTHQTFEDVAIMRAIPNTIVLVPSDAGQVDACLRAAIAYQTKSPIYIRLGRGPEYSYSAPGAAFEIGKAISLRQGRDVSLIANGSMVVEALLAADALKTVGIEANVLNVHTVKPIDAVAVREAVAGTRAVVVAEEHSIIGGLGSAVLEALAEVPHAPVRRIGIRDEFPPIGPTRALRQSLGLSAEGIAANVLDMLGHAPAQREAAQ
ncbi:MAG: transketolase family protein [Devosia sp.]